MTAADAAAAVGLRPPAAAATTGNTRARLQPGQGAHGHGHPCEVEKSEEKCKRVAESFGGSEKMCNFAPMKDERFVITGVNSLTGCREELSRPMTREAAEERLQREIESRRRQRYAAHKRLRVELRLPVQLTIKFSDYE